MCVHMSFFYFERIGPPVRFTSAVTATHFSISVRERESRFCVKWSLWGGSEYGGLTGKRSVFWKSGHLLEEVALRLMVAKERFDFMALILANRKHATVVRSRPSIYETAD